MDPTTLRTLQSRHFEWAKKFRQQSGPDAAPLRAIVDAMTAAADLGELEQLPTEVQAGKEAQKDGLVVALLLTTLEYCSYTNRDLERLVERLGPSFWEKRE